MQDLPSAEYCVRRPADDTDSENCFTEGNEGNEVNETRL